MASTHYRELQLLSDIVKEGDFRSERDEFNLLMRMNDELSTSVENLRCLNDLYCDDQDFAKNKGALEDFIGPELREFTEYSEISEESLGAFTIAAVIVVLGAIIALLVWLISFLRKSGGGSGGPSSAVASPPSRQDAERQLREDLERTAKNDQQNSDVNDIRKQMEEIQKQADAEKERREEAEKKNDELEAEKERLQAEAEEARRREEEARRQEEEREAEEAKRRREEFERQRRAVFEEQQRKKKEVAEAKAAEEEKRAEAERKQAELEEAEKQKTDNADTSETTEESGKQAKEVLEEVIKEELPEPEKPALDPEVENGLSNVQFAMSRLHFSPDSERIQEIQKEYTEYLKDYHQALKKVRDKLYVAYNRESKSGFPVAGSDGTFMVPKNVIESLGVLYKTLGEMKTYFKDIQGTVGLLGQTLLGMESDIESLTRSIDAIPERVIGTDEGKALQEALDECADFMKRTVRLSKVEAPENALRSLPSTMSDPLRKLMDTKTMLFTKINEAAYVKYKDESITFAAALENIVRDARSVAYFNLYERLKAVFAIMDQVSNQPDIKAQITKDNLGQIAQMLYAGIEEAAGQVPKYKDIYPAIDKVKDLCSELKEVLEPTLKVCENLRDEVERRFKQYEKPDATQKSVLRTVLTVTVNTAIYAAERVREIIAAGLDFVYTSEVMADSFKNVAKIINKTMKGVMSKWKQKLKGHVVKLIVEHLSMRLEQTCL